MAIDLVLRSEKSVAITRAEHDQNLTDIETQVNQNETDISALDGRLTTAENDIDNLESDMSTAQGDIIDNAAAIALNTSHRNTVTGNPHAVSRTDLSLSNIINGATGVVITGLAAIDGDLDVNGTGNSALDGNLSVAGWIATTYMTVSGELVSTDGVVKSADATGSATYFVHMDKDTGMPHGEFMANPGGNYMALNKMDQSVGYQINNYLQIHDAYIITAEDFYIGGDLDVTGDAQIDGALTIGTGASITEFSTDGTLADNSDTAVPTEKAVKTYVDAHSGGMSDIVDDTTPQLGGDLDVNGNDIVSVSNGDIAITPDGTGKIILDGLNWPTADGSNGQVLQTNGSGQLSFATSSGGAAQGKNAIINGNFDIWQRSGAPFSTAGYTADRWVLGVTGDTPSVDVTAFTVGQTDVPGEPAYHMTFSTTYSSGAGNYTHIRQAIENVRSFAGQTVTLSFYAKVSSGTPNIAIELYQNFGSGGSSSVTAIGAQKIAMSTTWTKYTATIAIPSISGKTLGTGSALWLVFWISAGSTYDTRSDTLGQQSITLSLSQVQLESGSSATDFEIRSKWQELEMCKRYYQKLENDVIGYRSGGSWLGISVPLRPEMRATPTVSQLANNVRFTEANVSSSTSTYYITSGHVFPYRTSTGSGNIQWSETLAADAEL